MAATKRRRHLKGKTTTNVHYVQLRYRRCGFGYRCHRILEFFFSLDRSDEICGELNHLYDRVMHSNDKKKTC